MDHQIKMTNGELLLSIGGEQQLLKLSFGSVRRTEAMMIADGYSGNPTDWDPLKSFQTQFNMIAGCLAVDPRFKEMKFQELDSKLARDDWRANGKALKEALASFLEEPEPNDEDGQGKD